MASRPIAVKLRAEEADAIVNALRKTGDEGAAMAEKLEKSFTPTARAVDNLKRSLDPLYDSQRRIAQATGLLDRALKAGTVTAAEHARLVQLVNERYAASAVASRGFVAANNNIRMAVQQAGFQVGDFAVQIASGQSAMRAFVQQGSQLLGFFGPWGAVFGAGLAVVGALATGLAGLGDKSEDAASAAETQKRAQEALSLTLGNSIKTANELADAYRRLSAEMRAVEEVAIRAAQRKLSEELSKLRKEMDDLLPDLSLTQLSERLRPGAGGELSPEAAARVAARRELAAAVQRFREGGSPEQLVADLRAIAERSGEAGREVQKLAESLVSSAKRAGEITEETKRLEAQLRLLAGTATAADRAIIDGDRRGRDERQKRAKEAAETIRKENEARDEAINTVKRQIEQLGREADAVRQGERERFVLAEVLKAESALRKGLVTDTEFYVEQVRKAAEIKFDEIERTKQLAEAEKKAAREAEQRAKEEQRRFERTVQEGVNVAADILYDAFTGRISSIGEFLKNTLLRATAQGIASAFLRPLVIAPAVQLAGQVAGSIGIPVGFGGGTAAVGYGGGLSTASNVLSLGANAYSLAGGGSLFGGIGAAIDAWGASVLGIGSALPSAITSAGSIGVFTSEAALAGAASSGGLLSGVSLSTLLGGAGLALGGIMLAGSLFGNRRYGFFGPKPSVGPNANADIFLLSALGGFGQVGAPRADNGGDAAGALDLARRAARALNELRRLAGGTFAGEQRLQFGSFKGQLYASPGGVKEAFFRGSDPDAAVLAAARYLVERGTLRLSGPAASVFRRSDATSLDELVSDLELARTIDRLKLDDLSRSIAEINDRYAEQIERAKQLGLAEGELVKARDREIAALRAAELAPFAQAGASIRAFLEAQALSPESSLSPTGRLTEAQRQFGQYLEQVRGGDLGAVSPLLAAGQNLLAIGRAHFASTVDFANIEHFVRSSLASVGQQVTSDSYIEAVRQQTQAQIDQFQQLKEELQKLRSDLALLGKKLAA